MFFGAHELILQKLSLMNRVQYKYKIKKYFSNLGFDYDADFQKQRVIGGKNSLCEYSVADIFTIYFLYLPDKGFDESLFTIHQHIWNENRTEVFIVISDYKTHLCSSKYKPEKSLPNACRLDSFDYGINSPQFDSATIEQISKENIDYGSFWNFVMQKLKEKKRKAVDDDLLLNLIILKDDLKELVPKDKSYILIERCLFLKFLEDRHFLRPETLLNILHSNDCKALIDKFDQINMALNGDIFEQNVFLEQDIPGQALSRLYDFFTTDYRRQIRLFPYDFSVLPVELLSNIYEVFLKVEKRIDGGIYYTPTLLADIILNETLDPILKNNHYPTCMDFSCGSGVFLVRAFERLIKYHKCSSDFAAKKAILENCIFGIEKDEVAARITIFSLYLKLLEGEEPTNLRCLIDKNMVKFPKLFMKNIQRGNTLFDEITFENEGGRIFKKFDVMVGNPPWGVNLYKDSHLPCDAKMILSEEKQKAARPSQSSQYFILKAEDFMSDGGVAGILTNNSNLLATTSRPFITKLLESYNIQKIYDFTHCNQILFMKRELSSLNTRTDITTKVQIGADEPAIALILKHRDGSDNSNALYIRPSLDILTRLLRIISVKASDIKHLGSFDLRDSLAWRVLTLGEFDDYELLKKIDRQKGDTPLESSYGFQFKSSGEPIWTDFNYYDKDSIDNFKVSPPKYIGVDGASIRRPSSCLQHKVLVRRYISKDLRVKAAYDDSSHKHHESLIGLSCNNSNKDLLLSLCNSSLMSYFLFFNSAQIGKHTYNMLNTNELASIPIPSAESITHYTIKLKNIIDRASHYNKVPPEILEELDEIVFDIFNLRDFEKQRIRDHLNIADRRIKNKEIVTYDDFNRYTARFRKVMSFILKDDKYLNAESFYSNTIGGGITFTIVDMKHKVDEVKTEHNSDLRKFIAHVAHQEIKKFDKENILKQEKIRFYNKNSMTIMKSNYFVDWTETAAVMDAKEEIELFVKDLPER